MHVGALCPQDIYQIVMLPDVLLAFTAGPISEMGGAVCC
jgi:hypothetical protein